MSEAAQTLEGWYALHDFRSIDWTAWKLADANERNTALDELQSFLKQWQAIEDAGNGSTVFYSIVGQKADFVFMHLRETLEELNATRDGIQQNNALPQFTIPVHSYVTIVELSNYMAQPGTDPLQNPEIHRALEAYTAEIESYLLLSDEQTPRRQ